MRALTNDQWGFPSNCFVCEAKNEAGLRIAFFHDEEADAVAARFTLGDAFSGAPTYAHGGVVLAVLDESMAWAAIAVAHRWAVTGETTTRFEAPVRVDRTYTVTARITAGPAEGSSSLAAAAEITGEDGTRCATAQATFVVLGEAHAADATGAGAGGIDASWTRPA
ncbi:MAG: PaaI family thioesterase [Acidimicrobiales bacterium]